MSKSSDSQAQRQSHSKEYAQLRACVLHAAHYLPAQGPIGAFVHHNTLHAFEELPFDQALEKAAEMYSCTPYLNGDRYRLELERGRIRIHDIKAVLQEDLASGSEELIAGLVSRSELRLNMLLESVQRASEPELQWLITAGDGIRKFQQRCSASLRRQMVADTRRWVMRHLRGDHFIRDRVQDMSHDLFESLNEKEIESWSQKKWKEITLTLLWRVAHNGVHDIAPFYPATKPVLRLRDAVLNRHGLDADLLVHTLLIRFCAAFTDQGLAEWTLPERDTGFYHAFLKLHNHAYPIQEIWAKKLSLELKRLERESISPEALIFESLAILGVKPEDYEDFITQSLLALRGWAGILWQLESRPDRVRQTIPQGTLLEFLAIRLLLDRFALAYLLSSQLGLKADQQTLFQSLRKDIPEIPLASSKHLGPNQRAYVVFLLAQSMGWPPQRLFRLDRSQWEALVFEIESFSTRERERIFQLAYERRFHIQVLNPIANYNPPPPKYKKNRPAFQVVCCLDDREESFRRHIEELEPEAETFGWAGFYDIPMYYRGIWDVHEMPLCPVSIRPKHRIWESVRSDDAKTHHQGVSSMRHLGRVSHRLHSGSHGFMLGLATTLLGSVTAIPLVARVLFPRLTSKFKRHAVDILHAPIHTELTIESKPGPPDQDGIRKGFLAEEMLSIVEGVLRGMGLTQHFSRLVLIVGHGSSSLNNPHEAAYECGACGGGSGGPNARVFSQMANHPFVRAELAKRGLLIPEDTLFLGAYHNTCSDQIIYYDLEKLPEDRLQEINQTLAVIEQACNRNAHERSRRFRSADLLLSAEQARRHVEERSEDLAQPRPECGHATNAICVVGRRSRTKGLFLDRRSFLVSYDPESDVGDSEMAILMQVASAAIPICAGINLEYYFSYVDPHGWGCDTKLPHNITSLVGVMDGSSSDLRPGLPWQMVEIHEPVRLLTLIESTPEKVLLMLQKNETLARLCNNAWIWLACLDPESSQIQIYRQGAFVPYQAEVDALPESWPSSRWYSGLRENLDFAAIHPQQTNDPRSK